MSASSPNPSENARKITSAILHELANVGQNQVAADVGTSDSSISRLKGDIPLAIAVLDRLGFQVVPKTLRCFDEPTIGALVVLAKQRMAQIDLENLASGPESSSG